MALGLDHACLPFDNTGASSLDLGFLSLPVDLEQRLALLPLLVIADIDLRSPTAGFCEDRYGPKHRIDVLRGGVIVQHDCDQQHGQDQTKCDTPAKLVTDRK